MHPVKCCVNRLERCLAPHCVPDLFPISMICRVPQGEACVTLAGGSLLQNAASESSWEWKNTVAVAQQLSSPAK